jgi:hypothetical protein
VPSPPKLGIEASSSCLGRAGGEARGNLDSGAQVVAYDRYTESREEIGARLAEERGCVLVPSFADIDVIEGQGTAGVEIAELLGGSPDKVLVCCGGGGLSAGIALALPEAEIVTVEPVGWDDMARSLEGSRIVPVADDAPPTRCDALQTKLGFTAHLRRASSERRARRFSDGSRDRRRNGLCRPSLAAGGGARRCGRACGGACGQGQAPSPNAVRVLISAEMSIPWLMPRYCRTRQRRNEA